MTRVLNQLDADTAARVRAAIAGKPQLREAKPKKAKPVKCLVSEFHKFDPRNDSHTIQLAIHFESYTYNAESHDIYIGRDGKPRSKRADAAKKKKKKVGNALARYLPRWLDDEAERARLKHIEFVRIGMRKLDDDNVWIAFKAIRDRTCSFAAWGRKSDEDHYKRIIGQADDILEKRGVTWRYRQIQCPSNPRAYGIQIILHCAPSSTTP
jgi:hypothetical protein